jgi:glutamate dehydrogenase/leucine dehydrogenase
MAGRSVGYAGRARWDQARKLSRGRRVLSSDSTVTGQGRIDWIAQNGIQISFGATGIVTGNFVSKNFYTPKAYTACGLLFYQAAGVKQSGNDFSGNEVNICNAGRGKGNVAE